MAKNIADYLHLYLGCEVETVDGPGINLGHYYPDVWVKENNIEPNGINVFFPKKSVVYVMNYGQCKLMLRTLSSMTTEELMEMEKLLPPDESVDDEDAVEMFKHTGAMAKKLLEMQFDLFDLIEEGLAIDATKQTAAG